MKIGEIMKTKRIEAGMSQTELENITDVSQHSISVLEQGKTNPSYYVIDRICKACGIKIEFGGKEMDLSDMVYEGMRERNLVAKDLREAIGITGRNLSQIINKRTSASIRRTIELANYFEKTFTIDGIEVEI